MPPGRRRALPLALPRALPLLLLPLRAARAAPCPRLAPGEALPFQGVPDVLIDNVYFAISVPLEWSDENSTCSTTSPGALDSFVVSVGGDVECERQVLMNETGDVSVRIKFLGAFKEQTVRVSIEDSSGHCGALSVEHTQYVYSRHVCICPLLVVLVVTPLTREMYFSLGLGGFVGTLILKRNVWDAWTGYFHNGLTAQLSGGFSQILLAMLLIGAIGGLAARSGGIKGLGQAAAQYVVDSFFGQVVVFLMGFAVFMDDYANTIIVGFSLRSVTDTMRVSREKLSFLVDCTASPVAGVMPLSTWIAHEVAQIQIGVEAMRDPYTEQSPYFLFLMSIPRRFYSWFMLIFVANTILSGRDWGPMHAAERRARQGRGVAAAGSAAGEAPEEPPPYYTQVQTETFAMIGIKPGIPCRMVNAALPFFIFVVLFIPLLFYHGAEVGCDGGAGWGGSARDIIGCAEAFPVLHWTAATVICFQIVFYMCQYDKAWGGCLLRPAESIDAALNGSILYFKAAVALLLAFTYAQTVKDLQLGVYLVDLLGDSVSEAELPMLVFILCAIFSLATGTSWGTMTVFMPAVIPLAEAVGGSRNVDLLVTTMSAVLGGAVWGDHCSPVSDTTILSAASCQVSLMDHAKTQIPYALFSGLAAILLGFWPCGAGVPSGVCILIGLVVIPLLHYLLSLLGRVIPGFGGTVEVYHPLRGRSIGEGFAGTRAALRSAVGAQPEQRASLTASPAKAYALGGDAARPVGPTPSALGARCSFEEARLQPVVADAPAAASPPRGGAGDACLRPAAAAPAVAADPPPPRGGAGEERRVGEDLSPAAAGARRQGGQAGLLGCRGCLRAMA